MELLSTDQQAFRICQLTDLHLGSRPFSVEDQETLKRISRVLASEHFDLIMITGDLIWGNRIKQPEEVLSYFYGLFDQIGTPIAVTYGNHDTEGDFGRSRLRELEKLIRHPASKYDIFVFHDLENYVLKVFDRNSRELSHLLYVWDSGAYSSNNRMGLYEPISPEQIRWFAQLPKSEDPNRADLGFIHIPIPEFAQAQNLIRDGQIAEKVGSPEINSGLFYSLLQKENFKALFAGHDHDNNFTGSYKGIDLVYGNVSGYNTYGKLARGYKLIELYPDHATYKNIPFIID
ncbi:MAG: metallophosphoesterase family protein [Oenococcus sp.]|uniref:metallophosphoesterase family protein n=1 Tax=Oenococcus sp. TaxID=1979414 RepID=UPI0039EA83E3